MSLLQYTLLAAITLGFVLLEVVLRRTHSFEATRDDLLLDVLGFGLLAALTQPFIFAVTAWLGAAVAPELRGALSDLPWWAMAALLLVGDDMLQYWWHRASHTALLWPLHRAHHSAHYMSARMVYRNNAFYYVAMPAVWVSGALVYLGLGEAYLVYIVVKLSVITGAHSDVRWDEPLYRVRALRPVMWVVQRTISTPSTHFAHHALTNADGVGWYKGNFGNLLFLWDVIFGTAHITQRYPLRVGLPDDLAFGKEKWWVELFYPIFRSTRAQSALVPGGVIYEDPADVPPPPRRRPPT